MRKHCNDSIPFIIQHSSCSIHHTICRGRCEPHKTDPVLPVKETALFDKFSLINLWHTHMQKAIPLLA